MKKVCVRIFGPDIETAIKDAGIDVGKKDLIEFKPEKERSPWLEAGKQYIRQEGECAHPGDPFGFIQLKGDWRKKAFGMSNKSIEKGECAFLVFGTQK
ncbi:MAG: hypothetical protein SVK08_00200 [Halobacteriota archaeon]|nr:hypothetical protein [Halobacteriota archaeon]